MMVTLEWGLLTSVVSASIGKTDNSKSVLFGKRIPFQFCWSSYSISYGLVAHGAQYCQEKIINI